MSESEPASRRSPDAGGDIASFVLRFTQDLYHDEAGEPRVRWRGHIRHVQSDAEERFTEFADAVAFMQHQLAELTMNAVADRSPADQRQALADSFQLWERFTSGYAAAMLDAFNQTLSKSAAVRQQVGEQIERSLTWWSPFLGTAGAGSDKRAGEGGAVLAALADIAARLQALESKVDRLAATASDRKPD